MGWIDEARLKIAKRKAEEEAKRAKEAKASAAYEAKENAKRKDLFVGRLKKLLPRSVELVSVFIHDYDPGGRVHMGDGVQFDLVRSTGGEHHSVEYISVYEAGSDRESVNRLAFRSRQMEVNTFLEFGKSAMEELLLDALEKYYAKREAR
jgi:hypothetical protein